MNEVGLAKILRQPQTSRRGDRASPSTCRYHTTAVLAMLACAAQSARSHSVVFWRLLAGLARRRILTANPTSSSPATRACAAAARIPLRPTPIPPSAQAGVVDHVIVVAPYRLQGRHGGPDADVWYHEGRPSGHIGCPCEHMKRRVPTVHPLHHRLVTASDACCQTTTDDATCGFVLRGDDAPIDCDYHDRDIYLVHSPTSAV